MKITTHATYWGEEFPCQPQMGLEGEWTKSAGTYHFQFKKWAMIIINLVVMVVAISAQFLK
jgi:hypothetical protein